MQYRSEIDGLRSLAIIPVVFFHGGFSLFSGGFVGVDVFFVISGYLITLLIYTDILNKRFSAKKFYERRIKRLFPALFFVTLCTLVAALSLYQPYDLEDFLGNLASVFAFSSNVHFYHQSGYFSPSAELNTLLHTWSLSVEEQFYFIFPWLLVLALKIGKKFLWVSIVSLALISLGLAEWRLENKPMAAFYLLYARGWELLIGSICALLVVETRFLEKTPRYIRESFSIIGLMLIIIAIFTFSDTTPTPGVPILVPTMGAAFIILFSSESSVVGRILSNKYLVFFGVLSYSTYLWHQPLLAFSKSYLGAEFNLYISALVCSFSFIAGYLSWKFIENPFRYDNSFWDSRIKVFSIFGVSTALILCLSLYGKHEKGFPQRLSDDIRSVYLTEGKYEQIETCFITEAELFDVDSCFLNFKDTKNAIIIGDSHAASLYPSLRLALEGKGWSLSMLAYARCVPFINQQHIEQFKYQSRFISKQINSRCVTVKNDFKKAIKDKQFDMVIVLNHVNNWVGSYNKDTFDGFWELYISEISSIFDNKRILMLGSLPLWEDDLPKLITKEYAEKGTISEVSLDGLYDATSDLDIFMRDYLASVDVKFMSTTEAFCSSKGCSRVGYSKEGVKMAMAYDEAHLSPVGADKLADYFVNKIDLESYLK